MDIPGSRHGLTLIAEGAAASGAMFLFIAGARAARTGRVGEAERNAFAAVNAISSSAWVPVWAVMQLGSLGGAFGVAAAAGVTGHRQLARRLALAGATTWAAAKVVKQFVGRGRPHEALGNVRVLGRAASGLGYPSGHAAVASALGVLLFTALPPPARPWVPAVALGVGTARVYVGAHLPLDVAGGVAFGTAIGLGADVVFALASA